MKKVPIAATFIDEITYDIPSSNWSPEQWAQDLDHMVEMGIDTLVIMRGGFEDKTIFPSKVFGTEYTYDFAGLIVKSLFCFLIPIFPWCYHHLRKHQTRHGFISNYSKCPYSVYPKNASEFQDSSVRESHIL